MHRQLHPSVIGKIDLLDSSKDVGQSGMISPWADISTTYTISDADIEKYPNIKYELFKFITEHFPNPDIIFNAHNLKEYNQILDKLVMFSYMNMDYGHHNEPIEEESA